MRKIVLSFVLMLLAALLPTRAVEKRGCTSLAQMQKINGIGEEPDANASDRSSTPRPPPCKMNPIPLQWFP